MQIRKCLQTRIGNVYPPLCISKCAIKCELCCLNTLWEQFTIVLLYMQRMVWGWPWDSKTRTPVSCIIRPEVPKCRGWECLKYCNCVFVQCFGMYGCSQKKPSFWCTASNELLQANFWLIHNFQHLRPYNWMLRRREWMLVAFKITSLNNIQKSCDWWES